MNQETDILSPIQVLLIEDSPGDIRLMQEALKDAKVYNSLHSEY